MIHVENVTEYPSFGKIFPILILKLLDLTVWLTSPIHEEVLIIHTTKIHIRLHVLINLWWVSFTKRFSWLCVVKLDTMGGVTLSTATCGWFWTDSTQNVWLKYCRVWLFQESKHWINELIWEEKTTLWLNRCNCQGHYDLQAHKQKSGVKEAWGREGVRQPESDGQEGRSNLSGFAVD